jgi:hypothetical protein
MSHNKSILWDKDLVAPFQKFRFGDDSEGSIRIFANIFIDLNRHPLIMLASDLVIPACRKAPDAG